LLTLRDYAFEQTSNTLEIGVCLHGKVGVTRVDSVIAITSEMRTNTVDRLANGRKVSANRLVFLRCACLESLFQQRLRTAVVSIFEIDAEQHQCRGVAQCDVFNGGAYVFQFDGGGLQLMNCCQSTCTFNLL